MSLRMIPLLICLLSLYLILVITEKYAKKKLRSQQNVNQRKNGEYIPSCKSLFKMREKKKAFFFLCDHYLPIVVGKCKFKNYAHNILISDLATPSDEALVYLCLANNWDRWIDMASHDPPAKDSLVPTKYTERGKKAKEFCGWNRVGLRLSNRLMDRVIKDRSKPWAKKVEEEYMQYRKEKKIGRKEVSQSHCEKAVTVKVRNDLFPLENTTGEAAADDDDTDTIILDDVVDGAHNDDDSTSGGTDDGSSDDGGTTTSDRHGENSDHEQDENNLGRTSASGAAYRRGVVDEMTEDNDEDAEDEDGHKNIAS